MLSRIPVPRKDTLLCSRRWWMAIVVLGFFVCSCPASIIGADDANSATDKKGWSSILAATDPSQTSAVPSPAQLAYQTNQMGAFLHYGPAVFLDGDWKSVPDPKVFNPTQLDAEQWVRTTKSFDAKHLIFSSKHHNGFCLWPTKTTSYSVCSSPWKNGQGDVVREVAEACKKYGIALGLYYSGHDRRFPCYADKLMEQYYVSIGRGANFLNALVPDKRGLIDEGQAKSVAQFGAEVRRRFAHPLARTNSSKGWTEPGVLQLDLGSEKPVAHVVLEEEIAKGQHILKYAVDAATGRTWKTVAEGQSIGRKRIERFEPPITAERVRLRIVQANAIPSISAMIVYGK